VQPDLNTWINRAREQGRAALDEAEGKALLAASGIDVPTSRVIACGKDVRQAVAGMSGPFVLKMVAPGVLHKSDVGGVRVGLTNVDQVVEAVEAMHRNLRAKGIAPSGWLVEQMVSRGVEVVIGGLMDPEFGPMVMVGLGGIFVEVLKDVSFRICPIDERDAREMIEELRCAPLLRGVRGGEAAAVDALVRALVIVAGHEGIFLRCSHEVAEIDINPLIVTGDRAVAVDARFILVNRP
jgi:acetyl-CoA synthetase (ADP-forming)